jgi:hypothetical protein
MDKSTRREEREMYRYESESIVATGATGTAASSIAISTSTAPTAELARKKDAAPPLRRSASPDSSAIRNAVYQHIRAMRSLGRTTANTAEIAKALGVSVHAVEVAAAELRGRGVRRK